MKLPFGEPCIGIGMIQSTNWFKLWPPKVKPIDDNEMLNEDDDIFGDEVQPLLKKVKSKVIVEPLVEEDEQKVKLVPALILGDDESSPVDEIDGTEGKFNPL